MNEAIVNKIDEEYRQYIIGIENNKRKQNQITNLIIVYSNTHLYYIIYIYTNKHLLYLK